MTYVLTPEALQDISVKCVSQFMTKEASLSEVIAKEAQELELNPDQIKRVIETSNTLSYLRMLKEASDRTFEFPVAEYNQVLTKMAMPDTIVVVKTAASETESDNSTDPITEQKEEYNQFNNLSAQEKTAMLRKEMLVCREVLTKMAYDKEGLKQELVAAAERIRKDPLGLEKLAMVVEEDDYEKVLKLCGIEKKAAVDNVIFLEKELATANDVYELYKQAGILLSKEAELTEFVKKAFSVVGQNPGSISEDLAHGAGWAIGKAVKQPGKAVKGLAEYVMEGSKDFSDVAARKGMSSKDAVEKFNKIKSTSGHEAALREFGGHGPNPYHRMGGMGGIANKAFSAGMGLSVEHHVNANNDAWTAAVG